MQGYNTLWQTGVDHAGIATQIVVEQQLAKQGVTRHDLGRDAFVKKVWEWKSISGDTICQQQRRMGISVDWSRQRFTLDDGLVDAVQQVFISLYEEGLIYRGKRLVNWDPVLNTAVSDLEVINEEQDGHLWYFKYPLQKTDKLRTNELKNEELKTAESTTTKSTTDSANLGSTDYIVIATTRPETILGDVAVAVNPDDPRYQHLIGKHVCLPIVNRIIPIIADSTVDREFGSGCVKITPAHDFNDYAMGERHNLPLINIFTPRATIDALSEIPQTYHGLDRLAARTKIIAAFDALGLLLKIEPHRISIPKGERSGAIVEPYLTAQWFVKAKELAIPAIAAVKSGAIKFIPENWSKIYFQWLENIQDWCISRQLWWGHRIPAWYDDAGSVYVGKDVESVRKKYNLGKGVNLTQDQDVLDTWFSSALWPFSSLGWPEETQDFKTFYPTNVLVTGFDIIFFWVARMVMMGLKFTGQVPFREIYITGLIRDSKGKKMSKSKGNIIDPVDLIDGIDADALVAKRTSNLMQQSLAQSIEKATRMDFPNGIQAFGADALRFTFCALASTGRDINFDFGRLEGYRNFCTKLWNAARYVLMQVQAQAQDQTQTQVQVDDKNYTGANTDANANTNADADADIAFGTAELWIKAKLQQTIHSVTAHFQNYRFDLLAQDIYEFVWHEFCDWYVELAKATIAPSADITPDINTNIGNDIGNSLDNDTKNNAKSCAHQNGTRRTLLEVLETTLRLIHPIMPFISEEIWQQIMPYISANFSPAVTNCTTNSTTIMLQPYPIYTAAAVDQHALCEIEWMKKIVIAVRNIRGEMNIAPRKLLRVNLSKGTLQDHQYLAKHHAYLLNLARLKEVSWSDESGKNNNTTTTLNATAIVENLELHIPLADIIDKNAEINRLKKEISKLQLDHEKLTQKLGNQDYLHRAPTAIVNKEKQRLIELENSLSKLQQTYANLNT